MTPARMDGYARQEMYGAEADPQLAQRLHDEGLIWAVNRLVLHGVGLALGVSGLPKPAPGDGTIPDGVTVQKLMLVSTDDPAGIEYRPADDIRRRNLAKLRAAGHDDLADWAERITS